MSYGPQPSVDQLPVSAPDLSIPTSTAQGAVSQYQRDHPAWYKRLMSDVLTQIDPNQPNGPYDPLSAYNQAGALGGTALGKLINKYRGGA